MASAVASRHICEIAIRHGWPPLVYGTTLGLLVADCLQE